MKGVVQVGTIDPTTGNSSCRSDGAYLVVSSDCDIYNIGMTANTQINNLFYSNCLGKAVCTIDLSSVSWPSNCDTSVTAFVKAE